MDTVISAIDRLNGTIGRSVGGLTLLMVIVMFVIVILRYVFNLGWIAMQESVLDMHGLVFMLGMAYALRQNAHVRVDILYREFSEARRAMVNLLGTVLFLWPLCGFVFYSAWGYVCDSWAVREGSPEAGGLPGIFLVKTLILVMAVLVALQGLAEFLRALQTLSNKRGS